MPFDHVAKPAWLIELPSCESTNTWTLQHLDALAHGACVWTQRQTAGRGQNGKVWFSPPGVLTASFVLGLPPSVSSNQLSLCAGLAVAHAVEDLVPNARIQLKWPNDCYLSGRKLAGVLCERATPGSRRSSASREQVVVGIGLNLDPRWDQLPEALPLVAEKAGSPANVAEVQTPPGMIATLTALRRYLVEATAVLAVGAWQQILPQLRQRDWLRGRQIQASAGSLRIAGIAEGIDEDGCLLIREKGGALRPVISGSVTNDG